jgi:hypothetical protein
LSIKIFLTAFVITPILCLSQDCKTLNTIKIYHGLTLGGKFPDSIAKYFWKGTESFFLEIDSVKQKNRPWLIKFFSFSNDNPFFSTFGVTLDSHKNIYYFYQEKKLDFIDSAELLQHKTTTRLSYLYNEIFSLVGKETKMETIEKDNVLQLCNSITYTWQCEKVSIELSLSYGDPFLNYYSLVITDMSIERSEKLKKIKE